MHQDTATIGIVVLPPPEVREAFIDMASAIAREFPMSYVLDGEHFHPHLTLFQATVVSHDAASLVARAAARETTCTAAHVSVSEFSHFRDGFLFYHCMVGEALHQLHARIAARLHPYVARWVPSPAVAQGIGLPDRQAFYAQEFGYALCFDEWRPHVTVGRLASGAPSPEQLERIQATVRACLLDTRLATTVWRPTEIVVCDVGVDGACTDIRARFLLAAG